MGVVKRRGYRLLYGLFTAGLIALSVWLYIDAARMPPPIPLTITATDTPRYTAEPDPAYRDDALLLVNADHPLPQTVLPQRLLPLRPLAEAFHIDVGDPRLSLSPPAYDALSALLTSLKGQGYADLLILDRQGHCQNPGGEHQTGLALDLQTVLDLWPKELFDTTNPGLYLFRYGHEYGYVARYPRDKEEVTGIAFAPWHFRYVGVPHAAIMRKENLCLEEYIDFLHSAGTLHVVFSGGQAYQIVAHRPGSEAKAPEDKPYRYSRDNKGGTIVTVDLGIPQ